MPLLVFEYVVTHELAEAGDVLAVDPTVPQGFVRTRIVPADYAALLRAIESEACLPSGGLPSDGVQALVVQRLEGLRPDLRPQVQRRLVRLK